MDIRPLSMRFSWSRALGIATLAAVAASAAEAQPATHCDRACLTGLIDAYFAALIANDAKRLPQAARARITENGSEKPLAATFWDGAATRAPRP
jgi:hypothetical protein